ncbi:hypothetical protein [uncultured Roseobacter sp.]|uniref:hypothetical protein n=1 Tax=uncultured Roseobacter sp. TaxID=114847 RepID=UPI002615B820|nr:hypothetical protein [uncultured Roseobacter sp.]
MGVCDSSESSLRLARQKILSRGQFHLSVRFYFINEYNPLPVGGILGKLCENHTAKRREQGFSAGSGKEKINTQIPLCYKHGSILPTIGRVFDYNNYTVDLTNEDYFPYSCCGNVRARYERFSCSYFSDIRQCK